jgi:sulfotransferase family protein
MYEDAKVRARELGWALRRTAGRSQTLKQGYRWLRGKYREISPEVARLGGRGARATGANPENVIWIFGSGRSGSTWLRSMMGDLDRHQLWEEPMVGKLFGEFYDLSMEAELHRPDFIMANATRKGWTKAIRNFVLECASYARPRLGTDDYLVVKEPNGSMGAPLLMQALPESRMILLIRDPRDIVSSMLAGARQGGWMYERKENDAWKRRAVPNNNPDTFVRNRSRKYLQHAGSAKEAYDAHQGPKVLVRYEELRADTLATMKRIYSTLGIEVDEEALGRIVEKHSWENIPEEKKGEGKFYRKATPGGWREDLTPDQAKTVERITASLYEELYPG